MIETILLILAYTGLTVVGVVFIAAIVALVMGA